MQPGFNVTQTKSIGSSPVIKISFFIPKNYITHTVEPLILYGGTLSVRMDLVWEYLHIYVYGRHLFK